MEVNLKYSIYKEDVYCGYKDGVILVCDFF